MNEGELDPIFNIPLSLVRITRKYLPEIIQVTICSEINAWHHDELKRFAEEVKSYYADPDPFLNRSVNTILARYIGEEAKPE